MWEFWHTITKQIRTTSFFEIDPCFCVSGQTYPLAVKGAALDHYLPGFLFREAAINHIKCSLLQLIQSLRSPKSL